MNKPISDIFGQALNDYYKKQGSDKLFLHSSYADEVEIMPVDIFFRKEKDFPELEFIALALCDGKVLDIGAGAGSHSLYLQKKGFDVTAIELSEIACDIMKERGVKKVIHGNIFDYADEQFDTLLFLMNGIGLAQTLDGLQALLEHGKKLLRQGGQLLFDSSDINYLYTDQLPKPRDRYYGEIDFQYQYKGKRGPRFGWIYVDQATLIEIAQENGWVVQVLFEDGHDAYLVRLSLRES
ncbi:class I SAM-dependent methyltransferase [Olivibacter sitiensis]|uniref:class I SAM-dependent methyltransferase n=1 Tax=Olivibacter sitiensis TaxID=376470 RepID=UPI0003FEE95D|nr:class I SAM-dependent methyltransferase [Olivibacter sitiensis]